MPTPSAKKLKLFLISQNGTAYYGTGEDAHEVYSRLVAHDEKEGNYAHVDMLDHVVTVDEIDVENLPQFLGWSL